MSDGGLQEKIGVKARRARRRGPFCEVDARRVSAKEHEIRGSNNVVIPYDQSPKCEKLLVVLEKEKKERESDGHLSK